MKPKPFLVNPCTAAEMRAAIGGSKAMRRRVDRAVAESFGMTMVAAEIARDAAVEACGVAEDLIETLMEYATKMPSGVRQRVKLAKKSLHQAMRKAER